MSTTSSRTDGLRDVTRCRLDSGAVRIDSITALIWSTAPIEKIARRVSRPDTDASTFEDRCVRLAGKEPRQFFDNTTEKRALRREQWKRMLEIESKMTTEHAQCTDTRPLVIASFTVLEDIAHEIGIPRFVGNDSGGAHTGWDDRRRRSA